MERDKSESVRHKEEGGKMKKTMTWRGKGEDIPAGEGGHTVTQPYVETDGTYGRY